MTVTDTYQRPIISLRISITNRCNVNCFYCHHDGILPQKYEMTPDEIHRIAQVARGIGVQKIRLSGGEPLIRDDIVEIVSKISSIGFKDVSITTNGTYLDKYADDLLEAGLNRVNVSLDTLNPETYQFITKKDYLEKAKQGIIRATESGLYPVKLNMVVMKGINHNEIWDMFNFCKETGAILQLIELLKTDNCPDNGFIDDYHYEMNDLEIELADRADKVKTRRFMQDRKKYFVDGGEIEIVKPMDNTQFCKNCTRIRITPEGKLKPCLLRNDNLVDFIEPMRQGKSDEELKKLFLEAIANREPFYDQCH
ncbi:cyclic pyranopterin phosphate synthase [Methanobacterium subterraneum]|jgi:cyclic pyranopterin phosphate synthase|uniref:Probable GTP 3',8-cyclase n=1 Tax=Methanobacterium subterraneum TaxID=59277 RepID=A0A2H4VAK0_9EURY|nr:GTP 3',8-cyclase MoaA [Methanobacterium subterraneum]AUB55111.1 cyclic pyranopterin phosphate synthase [Methanobacterium subterraneum]PKL73330.1 MAG: GTP 3',8-cyclase MoaA [Methanobacteriales archaeon HGW-Methanobacteriales-2]